MNLFCDVHQTTHYVTTPESERLIYAALAPRDDLYGCTGDNDIPPFHCPLEVLKWANSQEYMAELVDELVGARQKAKPGFTIITTYPPTPGS